MVHALQVSAEGWVTGGTCQAFDRGRLIRASVKMGEASQAFDRGRVEGCARQNPRRTRGKRDRCRKRGRTLSSELLRGGITATSASDAVCCAIGPADCALLSGPRVQFANDPPIGEPGPKMTRTVGDVASS